MGLSPDDPRLGRVAYAKLQGDGLEYFVRKYEVLLGRKSKSTELDIVLGATPQNAPLLQHLPHSVCHCHACLGDNMNISRQHAKIAYNFALGKALLCVAPGCDAAQPVVDCEVVTGVFELTVMGKNGVTVNGVLYTPSSAPQQLYTQDFLQVGEQKFFFLLPKGTSRSVLLLHSGYHISVAVASRLCC